MIEEIKNAIIDEGAITSRGIIKWIALHYKIEHGWHTIKKYLSQMVEGEVINKEQVYTGGETLCIFKLSIKNEN